MGTSSNEVKLSSFEEVEDADTMVEIKIKTLDSQTYTLRVNKRVPVPALKEQIATLTGVLSEQQRLICRGKVLKDDELLSAYQVEDGHTLHLVVRQPIEALSLPSTSFVGPEITAGQSVSSLASSGERPEGNLATDGIVFEAVNIAQRANGPPDLGQFLSTVLSSILSANTGMGSRRDLRETNAERHDREYGNTSHRDASHLQQRVAASGVGFDPQQAAFRIPAAVQSASQQPLVIPDSLTTMNEYIGALRDEFCREGFGYVDREHRNGAETFGMQHNDGQNNSLEYRSATEEGRLPSPASLAETVVATRDLLIEHAGGCLSQLAELLEDHMRLVDPSTRMNTQSTAIRVGMLLQRLGSLLLELGRTTMTLRMGQTTSEAVVNSGPAVYISASGPNPMMVQAVPYSFPSSSRAHIGTISSGHASEGGQGLGPSYLPRSIDIRIHAGHTVPVASANSEEQVSAQQPQGQVDAARSSTRANFARQFIAGVPGSASSGESRVRVVPIRTVVAVPAGITHSPSDSSGSGVGILYPLLARVQQLNSSSVNHASGAQGGPEVDQQPTFQSTTHRQNLASNTAGTLGDGTHSSSTSASPEVLAPNTSPTTSGVSPSADGTSNHQGSTQVHFSNQQGSGSNDRSTRIHVSQQIDHASLGDMFSSFNPLIENIVGGRINNVGIGRHNTPTESAANQADASRDAEMQDASSVGNDQISDQAVFFSNMLRQIMPYISRDTASQPDLSPTTTSTSQIEGEHQTDASHSQSRRDPPADPCSKRQKRE